MATTLPQVTVAQVEANQGFTAHCHSCGWRIIRRMRVDADFEATEHRASHGTPLREDDDQPWRID